MIVTKEDVEKVLGARQKKQRSLSKSERRTVAIHEAGHAILAYVLPHCPTVERVTIASEEEDYLGYVMHAVSQNQHVRTRSELLDSICVALGGREAENMILGEVSSGCWNDLQQATGVASMMVEQLGMSDKMGVRTYRNDHAEGAQFVLKPRDIAETTAAEVDVEIREIVEEQRQRCIDTLNEYREQYDNLVEVLLDKSTIGLDEMKELFGGKVYKANPPEEDDKSKSDDDEDED